jgi:hypothetical protein
MNRTIGRLALIGFVLALGGCGGSSYPLSLEINTSPGTIAGGGTYTFTATTTNSTTQGSPVIWTLALNIPSSSSDTTTPCTNNCGAIVNAGTTVTSQVTSGSTTYYNTVTSMTYTAPLLPPTPNSIVLTATASSNSGITEDVIFTVGQPAIVVRLSNTFTTVAPGAAPLTLNAIVQFDGANAGVGWSLIAGGAACSPACGTLTPAPAPSFSAVYTPPATIPAAPNNSPTITATSLSSSTSSAFDAFTIQVPPPPVSVEITNPFTSIVAGAAGVTINATVTNDVQSQGVTWSISPTANTGALSASTALGVLYTPPNTAPQPPFNTPTITATSVADPTKMASFTFTINESTAAAQSACDSSRSYAFQLSGFDSAAKPIAMVGIMAIDNGKVTVTSVDVNDNQQITSGGGTTGACTAVRSEYGVDSVMISLDSALPLFPGAELFDLTFPKGNIERATLRGRDANRRPFTGEIHLQKQATFAQFGGDFVFHLTENAAKTEIAGAERTASVGRFTLNFDGAKGAISNGMMDASSSSEGALATEASVTGVATPPDANGRGTMNLNLEGQGSRTYIYYAAASNEFVLAEMDPTARPQPANVAAGVSPAAFGSTAFRQCNPNVACQYIPEVASGAAEGQSLSTLPQSATSFATGLSAKNFTYNPAAGRFTTTYTDSDGENHPKLIYLTSLNEFWQLNVTSAELTFSTFFTTH